MYHIPTCIITSFTEDDVNQRNPKFHAGFFCSLIWTLPPPPSDILHTVLTKLGQIPPPPPVFISDCFLAWFIHCQCSCCFFFRTNKIMSSFNGGKARNYILIWVSFVKGCRTKYASQSQRGVTFCVTWLTGANNLTDLVWLCSQEIQYQLCHQNKWKLGNVGFLWLQTGKQYLLRSVLL